MDESFADSGRQPTYVALSDGIYRARDLERNGISRQRIMRMTASGDLKRIGRGLYSRFGATVTENHTLAQVCARVPRCVICLASALQFHSLTTQNPWQVWVMVEKGAHVPQLRYPPLNVVHAAIESFEDGVEVRQIEGVAVRVTSVARTIADCFKYRNKVGLDVALEALKECLHEKRADRASIRHYARVCRVERLMRPYMEAYSI